ncbi:hypothetical protein ACIPPJ_05000 [Streptomyces sp. NPDC086091]|uniref:hypothetical protein n=1 Tax=Streptomyces sp. NPDC086091 TaxID=3365751 RepID=UPI0037F6DD15
MTDPPRGQLATTQRSWPTPVYAPQHRAVPSPLPPSPGVRRTREQPVPTPAAAERKAFLPYAAPIAVGGALPAEVSAPGRSLRARARAARLWFGAGEEQRPGAEASHGTRAPGPEATTLLPGTGQVPAPALAAVSAPSQAPGPLQVAGWTSAPPPPPPPRTGSGSGSGSGGGGGRGGGRDIPLDQTPEWAALMDLLASHERQRPFRHLDDPAFLDALAGRLHDRVVARLRRELVVDRERNGLLVPRT